MVPTDPLDRLMIMVGMPRAGTTYIYNALASHPSFYLPFRKELSYFSTKFSKGRDWYRSFFRDAAPNQVCADISPDYFLNPDAVARIASFSPKPKIILAVRDPASWAVSFHRHLGTFQWGVPPFEQFLDSHPLPDSRISFPWTTRKADRFSIRGLLVQRTVEDYRRVFGENLLVYSFDCFREDPLAVLRAIEAFLGLPHVFDSGSIPPGAINSSRRKNIKLLSYIFSRDELVTAAGHVLPRSFLRRARTGLNRFSIPGRRAAFDPEYKSDLALAHSLLSADVQYVESLFAVSPIMTGDGRVFPR